MTARRRGIRGEGRAGDVEDRRVVIPLWPIVDGAEQPIGPGDCLVLPAGAEFSFRVGANESFCAMACMRTGGQAVLEGETFAPPWTVWAIPTSRSCFLPGTA